LGSRERSSGIARARLRTLALAGAVLAASLAAPTTIVASQPEGGQEASTASPPDDPTPVDPEQPSPPPSPPQPSPPPSDQVDDDRRQPATPPTGRSDRGGSADAPTPRPTLASAKAAAKSQSVAIVGNTYSAFAYSPKSLTVHVGDRVRWDNQSAAPEGHNVVGDGLDSPIFHEGEDYVHRFSRAGTYNYICTLHPVMKGKVVVAGSSGGGGSGSGGGGGGSSGSGSSAGSSSGSSTGGSTAGDPGSSGQLPVTGLPLGALGVVALGLVALGLVARRWAENV
jgi:plastocyanin